VLVFILLFLERNQTKGKWVFPLLIILYDVLTCLFLFKISFPAWDAFAEWFALLPLT
jgi:hypothetical protein